MEAKQGKLGKIPNTMSPTPDKKSTMPITLSMILQTNLLIQPRSESQSTWGSI